MLRMRRITQILSAVAAAALFGTAANAGVQLQINQVPYPNALSNMAALQAAGYVPYEVRAVSDATSGLVLSFDFANPFAGQVNTPGIYGEFLERQAGVPAFDEDGNPIGFTGTFTPSPRGQTGVGYRGTGTLAANSNAPDTFWWNFNDILGVGTGVSIGTALTELVDMNAATPIADPLNNSANYGIATELKGALAVNSGFQVSDQLIAFLIAKPGSTLRVTGVLVGTNEPNNALLVDQSFVVGGPPPIPEPASLGVLALGGLALLARRRRA
jgi:hypothetical protein